MRMHDGWIVAVFLIAGSLTFVGTTRAARAEGVKPFPDEWFFDGAQRPQPLRALEGKPAPDLSIDAWLGDAVSLKDCRGKVVVVDFWATWCGPCMASIPHNVELVKQYGERGMVFVGVHDANAGWDRAPGVVKDKSINYPVGRDKGGESTKAFAVQFWPTYLVIDRAGVVRAAGLVPDRVNDVVEALLGEAAPPAAALPAEFAAGHYYGGEHRPRSLEELEGRKAPPLSAAVWTGTAPDVSGWSGRVSVVTFVSSTLGFSLGELDKIQSISKDLAGQGVSFVGICDARSDWAKVQEHAKATAIAFPIMQDKPAPGPVEATSTGETTRAFGVQFYPTTLIVDRTGTIRAAGVRTDKIAPIVEKLLGERIGEPPDAAPSPDH